MRFSKFFKSFSLILCTTPFILSCVSSKDVIYFNNASEVQPTGLTDDTTIRIQPNDELTIRVSAPEQEAAIPYNLTKSVIGLDGPQAAQAVNVPLESYIVDDNGYIQFPELGKIQVSGYTSIELADLLEEKIRPYLKEPLVTIRILNFQVTVLGEVQRPGTYTVTNNQLSLPQALSLGGDLMITGKRENILIMRKEDGKMTYNYIDITDATVTQSPYYYLQQNDVIYVEPNAGQIQRAGLLGTISTYLGVASVIVSLALIFTR
ncbi:MULTISPECIES: polysaccharide biosynthesis/export family protein [unclassified Leeuwenhoekiella]|uniref:polysaccharide biosynthesis/export family protein n=1 Tax=unclassified Leeuwenhoekiella TaxID=2615029 RepID=UPI0025B93FDC|nr:MULTISPECIES: polysaccharide biosynthesis/export family protein [unclassified Leeuwenhoekiella]|tara:strand:+ start:4201 stop:4989 length:789 start_codon:yes stop_codon:yes gene_type:complete